jgi:hypothetical protein
VKSAKHWSSAILTAQHTEFFGQHVSSIFYFLFRYNTSEVGSSFWNGLKGNCCVPIFSDWFMSIDVGGGDNKTRIFQERAPLT